MMAGALLQALSSRHNLGVRASLGRRMGQGQACISRLCTAGIRVNRVVNGDMVQMATILIIDDDFDIVDASKELLESVGHCVRIGHSGEEGLASLAKAALPDCLLLDVDMPTMNGPGMAHQMLLHDAGEEKIPILLVSGRNDLPAVAARMGTPYFLAKGSADYGEVLLQLLGRAIIERRAPATA
jgi:FixJ family two-component response regulator